LLYQNVDMTLIEDAPSTSNTNQCVLAVEPGINRMDHSEITGVRATSISGVLELRGHPYEDERGSFLNAFRALDATFAQTWCDRSIAQVNLSRTKAAGVVRGLHLQAPPHGEAKMVRCLRGRVWDVAVDLRPDSSTRGQWQAVVLSPRAANALLIPEGCAHGFQVLEPGSELLYLHSGAWVPEAETGVRFDDPQLNISWPLPPLGLSERDLALPLLESLP